MHVRIVELDNKGLWTWKYIIPTFTSFTLLATIHTMLEKFKYDQYALSYQISVTY